MERHVGCLQWNHCSAYNGITAQGFKLDVVNHQDHIINSSIGVAANHVEAMWQHAKGNLNQRSR